jgi:hypothetical protein
VENPSVGALIILTIGCLLHTRKKILPSRFGFWGNPLTNTNMFNKKTIFLSLALVLTTVLYGQSQDSLKVAMGDLNKTVETFKKLKITGWVQAQYQWAESKGAANLDGGDFAANSNQRFMIRRGRVKFTYTQNLSQFVMQINGSERGFNLVEIYARITEPWTKSISLMAGIMNRPFGFEIDQSSAVRESPERSRYSQNLMPNERDLGAKIIYEPVKGSKLDGLRLDAGFYNGQGIAVPGTNSSTGLFANDGVNEFDYIKDFIGRLSYYRNSKNEKQRYGIGFSHYNGGTANGSNIYYDHFTNGANGMQYAAADTLSGKTFKGKSAPRKYIGTELFFSTKSKLGTTILRGEYITGTQPGVDNSSRSASSFPDKKATYIRKFNGAYVYLIHRFGQSKHEVAIKYEWYDPNSKLSGNELKTATGMKGAEAKYSALGLGYNYYYDENVKFMFYYNIVTNEKTQITSLTTDLKDNILTVRMQYRF